MHRSARGIPRALVTVDTLQAPGDRYTGARQSHPEWSPRIPIGNLFVPLSLNEITREVQLEWNANSDFSDFSSVRPALRLKGAGEGEGGDSHRAVPEQRHELVKYYLLNLPLDS